MLQRPFAAIAATLGLIVGAPANGDGHGHDHHGDAPEAAHATESITVYKSPTCGCCKQWIAHLEAAGFDVEAIDSDDMNAVKQRYAVPRNLTSCHTARIAGYTIEGHVPADDIRRLLAERPEAGGLSVPGMPVGSPGMEIGDRIDPYRVMLFGESGESTWATYPSEQGEPDAEAGAAESG